MGNLSLERSRIHMISYERNLLKPKLHSNILKNNKLRQFF